MLALSLVILVAGDSQAQPLVNIETVTVGDPGNAADTNGYGSVAYAFRIGKHEVTIGEYAAFLNAVAASDSYGLYNVRMAQDGAYRSIERLGVSGSYSYNVIGSANRPISFVSWHDAARFCNWLHNGAGIHSNTETGAYALNGATSGAFQATPRAKYRLPTLDEWYKSAFHDVSKDSGSAGYWNYATRSDQQPGNQIGPALNQANYYLDGYSIGIEQGFLSDVGSYSASSSPYGTFDQNGNVSEWLTTGGPNDTANPIGGNWYSGAIGSDPIFMRKDFAATNQPNDLATEDLAIGFRVVTLDANDTDNDGVNDYREGKDGTDPNDPNSFNSLSKGLVAYYPFDGNADDDSGNRNDWVLSSSYFGLSDRNGVADRSFDCFSEGEVPLWHPGGTNSASLSIWFRPTAFKDSVGMWPEHNGPYTRPVGVFCGMGVILKPNGVMVLGTASSTHVFQLAVLEGWQMITINYAGSLGSCEVFQNGVPQKKLGTMFLPDATTSPSVILRMGGFNRDLGDNALDDVRVYNRTLSSTEVSKLYQTEAGNLDSDGDGLTDAWERGYGRYQIVEGNFTWQHAKADAEAKGGHLATITSQAEWDIIWTTCGANWAGKYYWLGASDRLVARDWRWVTDEAWSYNRWCPGEPSGGPEDELISWVDLPDGQPGWNDGIGDSLPGNFGGYLLEFGYPTDPFKADTDGDGYDDKVETDAKTDPNNPASFPVPLDADGDGIPDANETNTGVYVSPTDTGTDPNNPDTDGDGLSDGVETATGTYVSPTDTGTDPNIPDSDGDGLSDSVETNTGVYVSATNTGTNPLNDDTSSDGITDGEAVTAQFNPLIDQRPVLNFLTQAVAAQPNRFGFYNESNVMHLGMGGLMIRKSGSVVNLDLQWQTKNSLTNAWTNHGAPLPFFLNLPGSKAFIRLQATPGAP